MGMGWSTHRNGGWIGQLDRVSRWHRRILAAATSPELDQDDLLDFVYAFFQNCWHLLEWVQRTSDVSAAQLQSFRMQKEMLICRDLANGTKHLSLKSPSVDAEFSIMREFEPTLPHRQRLILVAQDQKYDLIALASTCLSGCQQLLGEAEVHHARPPWTPPR